MTTSIKNLTPRQAWQAIPHEQWGEEETRHLLRRAGFAATEDQVKRVRALGLDASLNAWFKTAGPMPMPEETRELDENAEQMRLTIRETKDPEMRRELQRELRQQRSQAYQDYGIRWLQRGRQPEFSAQEKYVLFLQNIFVVDRQTVQDTEILFEHQNLLRTKGLGTYPELAKAVSRSPAMIRYLNLDRSSKKAPNENFARELFELFTLGEGNYSEKDIKEAARAFTGYRANDKGFYFSAKDHDDGPKTVFGQTGNFGGDEVIDLVYQQPAAETFVPKELVTFYLCEQPLPEPFVSELGRHWRANGYDMSLLLRTFFSSRLFYAPEYRANLIKCPVQFYVGTCQNLDLDVAPLPGRVLGQLRAMGQEFYNPPNVRGWVGGKHWINATTLDARRQLTKSLFWGINLDKLNDDERRDVEAAREAGHGHFALTKEDVEFVFNQPPQFGVRHFCNKLLPAQPSEDYREKLEDHLARAEGGKYRSTREIIQAILQSPQYQLC
ncbi:MAG: DUF1800 domain-containing protein [Verrucomicrobiota bacterium JB024]|nr:DUF1800 domain-containing protein [Verrucomicrobiota bacterium JB024]